MLSASDSEVGLRNGFHTNHDRDTTRNGLHGPVAKQESDQAKGKVSADVAMAKGGHETVTESAKGLGRGSEAPQAGGKPNIARINMLPDEIQHITTDIVPLNLLLTRLAQHTHNEMENMINKMAALPLPEPAVNGNGEYRVPVMEDTSTESLAKKRMFLDFLKTQHTKWVKALVLLEWSKRSHLVGSLIDIRAYLAVQLDQYSLDLGELVNLRRGLTHARLAAPDLKSALHILEDGEVSFLEEFGFVEPPPISDEEMQNSIEELNTILDVRLALEEFEKIPLPFREYVIDSGRVTFRVPGEFEVDLTVADEDFESQFWFIDFRLLTQPGARELAQFHLRFLEDRVNNVLAKDGLAGCYRLLHEFVLTLKITEMYGQARRLSRGPWANSLVVERLNRAMSFQYWPYRYAANGPKSWVIVGVKSAQGNVLQQPYSPSTICLRWFRENKEVVDCDIQFDVDNIKVEELIKTVIARHIEHILVSIETKLLSKPRFSLNHSCLELKRDKLKSTLTVQQFDDKKVVISVDPTTGLFLLTPPLPLLTDMQRKVNASANWADHVLLALDRLRSQLIVQELHQLSKTTGWRVTRSPIKTEELKHLMQGHTREQYQPVWLRHRRLPPECHLLMCLGLAGDLLFLVMLNGESPAHASSFTKLPCDAMNLSISRKFSQLLLTFLSGLVTQFTEINQLKARRSRHVLRYLPNKDLAPQINLPIICIRLSELMKAPNGQAEPKKWAWAKDFLTLSFKGLRSPSEDEQKAKSHALFDFEVEASVYVADKSKLKALKGQVDGNVVYDARSGRFALRLRAEMGKHVMDTVVTRIRALERLVNFVDAIRKGGNGITTQDMTLRTISFTYGHNRPWEVRLDLGQDVGVAISLAPGCPHVRVLDMLERTATTRFQQLPAYLLATLPLHTAFDQLEEVWAPLQARGIGWLEVFPKSLEWYTLKYGLPQRRIFIFLDIALRTRKGEFYWLVQRVEPNLNQTGNGAANASHCQKTGRQELRVQDDIDRALHQRVWGSKVEVWQAMETSAAAKLDAIAPLLTAVDQAIRSVVAGAQPGFSAGNNNNNNINNSQHVASQGPETGSTVMRFSQSSVTSQPRHSQQTSSTPEGGRPGNVKSGGHVMVPD